MISNMIQSLVFSLFFTQLLFGQEYNSAIAKVIKTGIVEFCPAYSVIAFKNDSLIYEHLGINQSFSSEN